MEQRLYRFNNEKRYPLMNLNDRYLSTLSYSTFMPKSQSTKDEGAKKRFQTSPPSVDWQVEKDAGLGHARDRSKAFISIRVVKEYTRNTFIYILKQSPLLQRLIPQLTRTIYCIRSVTTINSYSANNCLIDCAFNFSYLDWLTHVSRHISNCLEL